MRAYAESKTIRLSHQSLGNAYVIYGDVSYLYRSVLHLIDNAIKFTPERGQVSIELAYSHHDILIRVMDTGPGIPDEDLPLLFERYYRDTPTSDGRSGIGLGLEFVRSTVEAHRGSVSVRNGDDGGAEFLITLPSRLRA
jgi:signal transduction histidine kinase